MKFHLMNVMFGIELYCAPSGLRIYGDVNPGRCPGLSHFVPLGRESCSELEANSVVKNFLTTAIEGELADGATIRKFRIVQLAGETAKMKDQSRERRCP